MLKGKLPSTTWPSTDSTRKVTVYVPGDRSGSPTVRTRGSAELTTTSRPSTRTPSAFHTATGEDAHPRRGRARAGGARLSPAPAHTHPVAFPHRRGRVRALEPLVEHEFHA